jgi:endonuclease/exonuclease/phosphatase family metal-dependent hydrolase
MRFHLNTIAFALLAIVTVLLNTKGAEAATLVAAHSGKCLDLQYEALDRGTRIAQKECDGSRSQTFTLIPTDSGYYRIQSNKSGNCVNISGKNLYNGGLVIQWTCTDWAINDQFLLSENSDGSYSLAARHSGLCVDVPAKSLADDVALIQWTCHGGANQRFWLDSGESPTPPPTPPPTPEPTPTPEPPSNDTVRVLQWNVEDGEQAGEITKIVEKRPDIVFLQEVDRVGHIEDIRAALESSQDVQFHRVSVNRDGSSSGASNLAILSRFPLSNVRTVRLGYEGESICGIYTNARTAIGATIYINGNAVSLFAVRTFYDSSMCVPQVQVRRLKNWVNTYYAGTTQIYGGDFNMQPGTIAYNSMVDESPQTTDSWYEAVLNGTASAYTTPSFYTPTRNTRMDYIFYRNETNTLRTQQSIIWDLTGYSDHRQVMTIFEVY